MGVEAHEAARRSEGVTPPLTASPLRPPARCAQVAGGRRSRSCCCGLDDYSTTTTLLLYYSPAVRLYYSTIILLYYSTHLLLLRVGGALQGA